MAFRECVVCGKTFDGAPSAKYCSEECKNAPQYTNEFNGEKWGKLTIIDAYRKKEEFMPFANVNVEIQKL